MGVPLSDLGGRARLNATQRGELTGTRNEQRVRAWLRAQAALGPLNARVWDDNTPPARDLGDALLALTVLCALWGVEITDAIESAVLRAEIGSRRTVPASVAPVPNARTNDGTLRDPMTGKEPVLE